MCYERLAEYAIIHPFWVCRPGGEANHQAEVPGVLTSRPTRGAANYQNQINSSLFSRICQAKSFM
jgi:hypothetical protein